MTAYAKVASSTADEGVGVRRQESRVPGQGPRTRSPVVSQRATCRVRSTASSTRAGTGSTRDTAPPLPLLEVGHDTFWRGGQGDASTAHRVPGCADNRPETPLGLRLVP